MQPVNSGAHFTLTNEAHFTSCEIQSRLEEYTPNYTQWIVRQARKHLGQRVLDIGCSTGNVTRHFADRELLVGVDANPHALDQARAGWADRPNVQLFNMTVPSDDFLALASMKFDSATCLNVIEHLKDDHETLRQIYEVLQPGGKLFLLVPANPWLYGTMDAADHHYRRYTRPTLRAAVEGANFRVLSMWAMNSPGILGWFLNGRILKREILPSRQAGLYDRVIPLVERFESVVPVPVGQSLVIVAQR